MASPEEINRAARAVAAMVVVQPQPLRVRLGEMVPKGGTRMGKKVYPGVRQSICEILVAHPQGLHVADIWGKVRETHPDMPKQPIHNMLHSLSELGHTKNLGKGSGMWGPGSTPFGKKKRVYKKRAKKAGNGAWQPTDAIGPIAQVDMEMAFQNLRVAIADVEKVMQYVMQEAGKLDGKMEALRKAVASLA